MKCECCGHVMTIAKKPARKAKGKFTWPPPVYVATYENGHEARMSFAGRVDNLDWAAVREQAARHLPIKIHGDPSYPLGIPTGAFIPMVDFHIEHEGTRLSVIEANAWKVAA